MLRTHTHKRLQGCSPNLPDTEHALTHPSLSAYAGDAGNAGDAGEAGWRLSGAICTVFTVFFGKAREAGDALGSKCLGRPACR